LDISVIIPVYNEKDNLPELCERLHRTLKAMRRTHETIFVDDGSRDGSLPLLLQLRKRHRGMVVVELVKNFGQHPAVTAGMEVSRGRIVVTLDADLQNPPEDIPKLVAAIEQGADIASGWRQRRHDSLWRTLPSRIVNRLISRMTRVKLHDYGCMLRAYSRAVIDRYLDCGERSTYITAFMNLLARRVVEVPVNHAPRKHGSSKYSYLALIRYAVNLMIGFSAYPIQVASLIGYLFSAIGLALGGWLIVYRMLHGTNISGLTSFVAVMLVLFGIQFILLGFMGEYLARVYGEVQKRPRYLVEKVHR
jgi:undecaprenyl-phosphate 4-deoxy-4-formamido-L-arabinose transferase